MKEDEGKLATTYGKRKRRQNNILFTVIASLLIFTVLLTMVSLLYIRAEDEAYEMLHIQTKQIKDDLTLQIESDRENLATMSHFAAELYKDGEGYDRLFDAFEPIGLFSNIGILTPDNMLYTGKGTVNLSGRISFASEAQRGEYISGRIPDLTREGEEIIRSAVPIRVQDTTVGILYGVIKLDVISERYNQMAQELDAQLFVYDKETGNYIINTAQGATGSISSLETREYNDGYTYEALVSEPNGYSSFKSIKNGQDLYIHYATMEEFNWGIMLARYESQVFAKASETLRMLLWAFFVIFLIMVAYVLYLLLTERRGSMVVAYASMTRKYLLEMHQTGKNIAEALKHITQFSEARSAFAVDADGEEYYYVSPDKEEHILQAEERKSFIAEVFQYAAKHHKLNRKTVGIMCIKPDAHMQKTNAPLYHLLREHQIASFAFAYVVDKNNHMILLGVVNSQKEHRAGMLLEDVAVCFSIALYNNKHLNKTEAAAVTDSLTGAMNRVAYKKDIFALDEERPADFSCLYIDVNELHLRNNKYGHAAGDEMLIYIANTLKEVFYGHYVYRMGGDEFLVFIKNVAPAQVKLGVETFMEQLKLAGYNVAIGMSYRKQNVNCEEQVREAEIRMYEAKAQYYQSKEKVSVSTDADKQYVQLKTGIREIDTMLAILKEHYHGIYRVNLDTDYAHRILMPSYFGYKEDEEEFSKLFAKYVHETVHPDFYRPVMNFLNYEAIKNQLAEGMIPRITYKKINGEMVILSIYSLQSNAAQTSETLWVFAKD